MTRRYYIIHRILFLGIALIFISSCGLFKRTLPIAVVEMPKFFTASETVEIYPEITPVNSEIVSAGFDAVVSQLNVKKEKVKKDQLVVKLRESPIIDKLSENFMQLEKIKTEYETQKQIYDSYSESFKNIERSYKNKKISFSAYMKNKEVLLKLSDALEKITKRKLGYEVNIKKLQHQLEKTNLFSSIKGNVVEIYKYPADNVKANEPILKIEDWDNPRIKFTMPEKYETFFKVNEIKTLKLTKAEGFKNFNVRVLKVKEISALKIKVEMELIGPEFDPAEDLKYDAAYIELKKPVLCINKKSIRTSNSIDYVYIVDKNIIKRKQIILGRINKTQYDNKTKQQTEYIEVLTGINMENKILIKLNVPIKEGLAVKIIK